MTMLEVAPIWRPETQQRNFRAVLEAMSRPGATPALHGVDGSSSALAAVAATLLDGAVSLSDPHGLLSEADRAMLQAPRAAPESADYLLCRGDHAPAFEPKLGTLPCPEQSATLVVRVASLEGGELGLRLTGPGVDGQRRCAVTGLDRGWLTRREEWIGGFPLGVDLILVDERRVMALPRTTRVEVA